MLRHRGRERAELGHDGLAEERLQPLAFLGRQGADTAGEEGKNLDVLAHGKELASRADLASAGSNLEQIFMRVTGRDTAI